jgi:flagellar biosynthetic protein FliP
MSGGVSKRSHICINSVILALAICGLFFMGLTGHALAQPQDEPQAAPREGMAARFPNAEVAEDSPNPWGFLFEAPSLDVQVRSGGEGDAGSMPASLQIILLLTVLTLAPAILVLLTCFTRVVVVLAFVRNALSLQQIPPNQVIIGLALLITFFIMAPVYNEVEETAIGPLRNGEISGSDALERASVPVRGFMLRQTREKDLALFVDLSGLGRPNDPSDVPTYVIVPAFVISELKTAFEMGFMIFIPFLVIDMVVASTLMSMGMLMLPPVMISLPLKVLLFVMVDGWELVVKSLVTSIR